MRAAVLLTGEPRFCREFDILLDQLRGADSVDWFIVTWKSNQPTSSYRGTFRSELIPPPWITPCIDQVRAQFSRYLPPGHRLRHLELVDQDSLTFPPVQAANSRVNTRNVWLQYWAIRQADLVRQAAECEDQCNYHVIMRTRADLLSYGPIDLGQCWNTLAQSEHSVIMPDNYRSAYGQGVTDLLLIAGPKTMARVSHCYDLIPYMLAQGAEFHPEQLLEYYLTMTNIKILSAGLRIDLRLLGQRVTDQHYQSLFGRWAEL